jgi:hypothetical protein
VKYRTANTNFREMRTKTINMSKKPCTKQVKIGINGNYNTVTNWNRMVGEMFFRQQQETYGKSVHIARNLSKMVAPRREFIFNKKTDYMGKILIDTWEARLTMEKEGLVVLLKQDTGGENKRVIDLSSIIFCERQCVLSSKLDTLIIEDKGSVGCFRKKIRSLSHDINLDRLVIGTTYI